MILVELSKLYENLDEATVGEWHVAPGTTVKKGDALVELITDKMVVDIDAPEDGILLKIYAAQKSVIPVGYVLCALGQQEEQLPDVESKNTAILEAHQKENAIDVGIIAHPPKKERSFQAAPAAKIFAKQQNINLEEVADFCGRNVIHRKDVEDFIASQKWMKKDVAEKLTSASEKPESPSTATIASSMPANTIALVTGGTGAIGREICRVLAKQGISVAIHTCSKLSCAQELAEELNQKYHTKCQPFQYDLTASPEQADKLIQQIQENMGNIGILINNAGILLDAPLPFMSDAQWNNALELNLTVPFRLIRKIAMQMVRNRWGRIVNLCSDAGRMGAAARANYSAAKAGLEGLTRSAAREFGASGITVNAIAPGFVEESPMTSAFSPERRKELYRQIPLRRFATPIEVADAVSFLALSQASAIITGQIISLDGGLFMG